MNAATRSQSPGGSSRDGSGALDWAAERATWPHADYSEFIDAGGLRWHVQRMGRGPVLLLVHGTGASTHSWRSLMPRLAEHYTVLAPDLPGHAFTQAPPRGELSLPGMARAIAALVEALDVEPRAVIGHSAGAAILARCCIDSVFRPACLFSINGALLPFRGPAGFLFPPLAKLLFLNPLAPRMFARSAQDHDRIVRLIHGTGSDLDEAGIALYARLFSSRAHVAATLGMMANWDLRGLMRDLDRLTIPVTLIVGEDDAAVAPSDAQRIRQRVPDAGLVRLADLGHLAHEEDAAAVARPILDALAKHDRESRHGGTVR